MNVYNCNHLMPTGALDSLSEGTVVKKDVFRDSALKRKAGEAKVSWKNNTKTGENKWFFHKLCF